MFAIWLLPCNNDFSYLEKIITKISLKFGLPKFIPHITIFGLVDVGGEEISEIVKKNIQEVTPFTVKISKISHSEDIWKSLFIEIKKNKELVLLNNKFRNEFKKVKENNFSPHISLMYNYMNKTEKMKIIQELRIKNEFCIDRISILKFSKNIKKWEIIEKFNL